VRNVVYGTYRLGWDSMYAMLIESGVNEAAESSGVRWAFASF